MSRLRAITDVLRISALSPSSITPGPDTPWSPLGNGKETLRSELEKLYWEGVKAEVENIIRTLKAWQQPEFSDVASPDEANDLVHGFDTFIDQVSQQTREFAIRYAKPPKQWETYERALEQVLRDRRAEYVSTKLKAAVRGGIDSLPKLEGWEQRAWALLQACGFLDIEKAIEHRPPAEKLGTEKRPSIPQLAPIEVYKLQNPELRPLHCARPDCRKIITGSMFTSHGSQDPRVICEDCYWQHYYGSDSYTKTYKHCVLQESITAEKSRELCSCSAVPHHDASGKPISLFPIDKDAKHLNCDLLKLGELVPWAKYNGLLQTVDIKETKAAGIFAQETPTIVAQVKVRSGSFSETTRKKASNTNLDGSVTDPEADTDIPLFLRKFARKNPFGDVHMALKVGPLIIENGVAHTKAGALVTIRDMPVFHERFTLSSPRDRALTVSGSSDRTLWQQKRKAALPKRYKAVMKQVVGAPFTGILRHEKEVEIVRDLLAASKLPFEEKEAVLDSALEGLVQRLKELMQGRVQVYLDSIASRLTDPQAPLTWSATKNNSQAFCASLLDPNLFEPLVSKSFFPSANHSNPSPTTSEPLYLISFVTRSGPGSGSSNYLQPKIRHRFDVPLGIIDEYLQRFHFVAGHDSADIPDTCHEYWHDWGAFVGGPPYPAYQTLFPWDCTEAFGRYPTRCGGGSSSSSKGGGGGGEGGGCNLAKHVWAFPFDSFSFVSHHLTRDRCLYPSSSSTSTSTSTSNGKEWMQSRLQLLSASAALTRGAAAMSRTPAFHAATRWLHSPSLLLLERYPALARVKTGGIHRAQPFSHSFDAGWGQRYFLAEWALWEREEQVRRYEELREERMRMVDIPENGDGNGNGWGRFYIGNGTTTTTTTTTKARKEKKSGKKEERDTGDSSWRLFAGFEGPADSSAPDRRRGGGNQSQGALWNAALMMMEWNADCGFTAGDLAGGGGGHGGDVGGGAGGGPGCAAVSCGSNCGSCSGSAAACVGGCAGGDGGGGSACGGGGGDSGGGGGGGGGGCGGGCGGGG